MAKLSDIANELGVSIKTVSMTLRDVKCASPETSAKIHELSSKIGYIPNQTARNMRAKATQFIGLLADMVATTPHSVELVRGAQAEAIAQKRHLLIGSVDDDPDIESDFLSMFASHQSAGVIYATMYHRCLEREPKDRPKNMIMVNCGLTDRSGFSILPDDHGGGYQQAAHLLSLGHRQIGVISLSVHAPASAYRLSGIRKALDEHGVVLEDKFLRQGIEGELREETYTAFEVALDMLRLPDRPTAIICGNDRIAMLVYCASAQLGLQIPRDLSLVGFDDFQTVSEGLRPELTTIALPYYEMGRRAVRSVLSGSGDQNSEEKIACKLIKRGSCSPLLGSSFDT